jgi:hypothetical protein
MSKPLSPTIAPRGINLKQAAAYWGVSPTTFRLLIKAGIAPPPIRLAAKGKQIFDRVAIDAAMDAASKAAG